MNYINEGTYVNFGLARGIGSASWATSALIFGQAVSFLGANILSIAYCVFALVTLFILYHLPESKITKTKTEEVQEEGSVVTVIKKYKIFFFLLLGFCFMFSGATAIGTYLINIVKSLGGNTSLYGVAMFAMAFSELPVMMTVPKLMKKFNSVTLILVASIFYICRNYTIGLAPNLIVLIIGMMFQGLSYGLFTGVITYYVTYNLDTQDQMSGQTMIGIMTSGIGSTLGNVLGGILQDTIGLNALFTFVYLMTALGAVIIFICKFVSIKVKK
ncbi:MFS transporter, partial [Faecalibacillus faecis]